MEAHGCTCQCSKCYYSWKGRSENWCPLLISCFHNRMLSPKEAFLFRMLSSPEWQSLLFTRTELQWNLFPGFVVLYILHRPELASLGVANWRRIVFVWIVTRVEMKWKMITLILVHIPHSLIALINGTIYISYKATEDKPLKFYKKINK